MAEGQAALPEADMQQPKQRLPKKIQGGIADALRDSSYLLSVMKLMFLMLIPNN